MIAMLCMKKILFFQLCLFSIRSYSQQNPWPVFKHYEGKYVEKIAMPVGGIGTGNISIGGNGQWKDVEIMNKPGMGFYGSVTPKQAPCFMVFTETSSGEKHAKLLSGPISPSEYIGSFICLAS